MWITRRWMFLSVWIPTPRGIWKCPEFCLALRPSFKWLSIRRWSAWCHHASSSSKFLPRKSTSLAEIELTHSRLSGRWSNCQGTNRNEKCGLTNWDVHLRYGWTMRLAKWLEPEQLQRVKCAFFYAAECSLTHPPVEEHDQGNAIGQNSVLVVLRNENY